MSDNSSLDNQPLTPQKSREPASTIQNEKTEIEAAIIAFVAVILVDISNGSISLGGIALAIMAAVIAIKLVRNGHTRAEVGRIARQLADSLGISPQTTSSMTSEPKNQWYYSSTGQDRHGPIAQRELERMLALGRLQPDALVWSEALSNWMPANKVDKLDWEKPKGPPPLPRPPVSTGAAGPARPETPPPLYSSAPPPNAWPPSPPGYPVYPPPVPDHITLTHLDRSARGRLRKVVGHVLMWPSLFIGGSILYSNNGRLTGDVLPVAGAGFALGFILWVWGTIYEYIYRRDTGH